MKKFKRKVLAMLMTNNFGSSLRQQLFDGAPFCSELLYTAVPQRAASGTTGTFTRATTKTWPNNDGYLVTGVAGEIGFVGARRIRSYISASSEDFSNAAWTKLSTTVVVNQAVAPNGTLTADLVHPASSGADRVVYQNGLVSTVVGDKMILEIYAKYAGIQWLWFGTLGGGTTTAQLPFFDLQNGVVGQAGTYFNSASIEDEGDGWYRCIAIKNAITAAPLFPIYGFGDADGSTTVTANGTDGLYLWGAQLEDVTAQTTQTAGEYVSVGVESAPYYHGSFVDGVKCYATDINGSPIPSSTLLGYQAEGARTNVLLHSNDLSNAAWSKPGPLAIAQNEIGVDGAISAWTLTDDNVGVDENVNQASVKTAATWTDSCYFKKTTGAQATYPVFYAFDGATRVALCTVDTTNGVATVWTAYTGLTVQPSVARCRSFNDDKWFVELSFTATAATWTTTVDAAGTTNATQSTGTLNVALTGSCVVERLQSELGSFASPYIATTTIAVARNKDELTYFGGDIPNLKTLAAIGFKRDVGVTDTGYVAAVSNGAALTEYAGFYLASAGTAARFAGADGGVGQWDQAASNAYTPGTDSDIAQSWATNSVRMSKDGVAQTADTTATTPSPTQLDIGNIGGSFQLNGNVGGIYGWTRNLSQSELNAVTA